jgi:hypothetical protein
MYIGALGDALCMQGVSAGELGAKHVIGPHDCLDKQLASWTCQRVSCQLHDDIGSIIYANNQDTYSPCSCIG